MKIVGISALLIAVGLLANAEDISLNTDKICVGG